MRFIDPTEIEVSLPAKWNTTVAAALKHVADAISEFRWQGWATDDHPVSPRSPRPRSFLPDRGHLFLTTDAQAAHTYLSRWQQR